MNFKHLPLRLATSLLIIFTASAACMGQWAILPSPVNSDLHTLEFRPGGEVWIGSDTAIVYSSNSGLNFSYHPINAPGVPFRMGNVKKIYKSDTGDAFFVGFFSTLFGPAVLRSPAPTQSWAVSYDQSMGTLAATYESIVFGSGGAGIAVGTPGNISTTTTGGASWNSLLFGFTNYFDVAYVNGSTFIAAGEDRISRTLDNGVTWTSSLTAGNYHSVSASPDGSCYAISYSNIIKSNNSGTTYASLSNVPDIDLTAIYCISADTVLVASINDVYISYNGGAYWKQFNLPNYRPIRAFDFANSNVGIAVGDSSYIIKTLNLGGTAFPMGGFSNAATTYCEGSTTTFTNNSSPAYNYQWFIDGNLIGTTYHFTTPPLTAGAHTIMQIAEDNGAKDTVIQSINVLPLPQLLPFTATAASICAGEEPEIVISPTLNGNYYKLFHQGFPIETLNSFGQPLTFTPNLTLNTSTNFEVRQYGANVCSTDSIVISLNVYVQEVPQGHSFTLYRDSVCYNDTTTAIVLNSVIGWKYISMAGDSIAGTGGTIYVPAGPFTGTVSYNYNFQVWAANDSLTCMVSIPGATPLHYHASNIIVDNYPESTPVNGEVNFSNNSFGFDNYIWDFGPTAIPQTYTGATPPGIQFTQASTDTVFITGSYLNICSVTAHKLVMVYDTLSPVTIDTCHATGNLIFDENYPVVSRLSMHNEVDIGYNFDSQIGSGAMIWGAGTIHIDSNYTYLGDGVINGQTVVTSTRFSANTSGIATDKLGNRYVAINQINSEYYTIKNRVNPPTSITVRNANIIAKFKRNMLVEWAMTSDSLIFADVMATDDGRIFVLGTGCWNGATIQLPNGGVYTFTRTPYIMGDAFIMEINNFGNIVSFTPFGIRTNAGRTLKSRPWIDSGYIGYPNTPNADTCAMNLRLEKGPGGIFLIQGVVASPGAGKIIEFGSVDLVHHLSDSSTTNKRTVFYAKYLPGTGFIEARSVLGGEPLRTYGITMDDNGIVYMSGFFKKLLITPGKTETMDVSNSNYAYLVAYDSTGMLWRTFSNEIFITDLGILDDGSVLAGTVSRGDSLIHNASLTPFYIGQGANVRYDSNGNILSINKDGFHSFDLDACRNAHGILQTGYWSGKASSISFNGTCPSICYSAYNSNGTDLSLDKLILSDTTTSGNPIRDINIKIRNASQQTVNAAIIKFQVNSNPVQSYNYSGNLNYTDTSAITIGTHDFSSRSFNRIKAWIESVNGQQDDELKNDTLLWTQVVCGSSLAGVYSVGPDTCYFDLLSSAAKTLKICGMNGAVKLEIEPGTYLDQVKFDLIPGCTAADSLWITSRTGDNTSVILDHKINPATQSASYDGTLHIKNAFTTISNVTLKKSILSPTGLVFMRNNGMIVFDNMKSGIGNIFNCRFLNSGFNNINTNQQKAIIAHAISDPIGADTSVIRITGNYFESQNFSIELISDSTYGNFTVINNKFKYELNNGLIMIDNEIGNTEVINNKFFRKNYYPFTNPYIYSGRALQLHNCNNFTIIGNEFISESDNPFSEILVYIYNCSCTLPCPVYNNIISRSFPDLVNIPNLQIVNSQNINIVHNSIGGGTTLDNSNNITFKNNLIRSNFLYVVQDDNHASNTYDFNNYEYDPSINPFREGGINPSLSLSAWQSLGHDINSLTVPLTFRTLSDLHLASPASVPGTSWPGISTDIDGEPRSTTTPTIGADEYALADSLSSIWPGDCDSSGVVDNYDLLPIGFYTGTYVRSRSAVAVNWQNVVSRLWPAPLQINGVNRNHADANGDGWVYATDTLAITQNYGLSYRLANPNRTEFISGFPELYLVPGNTTYSPGDLVHLDVMLGTAANPVTDFRGIGFQLTLDPTFIQQGTFSMNFNNNYPCIATDCIDFVRLSDVNGTIAASLVKTDGYSAHGYGKIGEITFMVDPGVTTGGIVPINFANYKAMDSTGGEFNISATGDTIQVIVTTTGNIAGNDLLRMYPNPAKDALHVIVPDFVSGAVVTTITDLSGKLILSDKFSVSDENRELYINIGSLSHGMYLVNVLSTDQTWTGRFIRN